MLILILNLGFGMNIPSWEPLSSSITGSGELGTWGMYFLALMAFITVKKGAKVSHVRKFVSGMMLSYMILGSFYSLMLWFLPENQYRQFNYGLLFFLVFIPSSWYFIFTRRIAIERAKEADEGLAV